jgi:hypothetical protein
MKRPGKRRITARIAIVASGVCAAGAGAAQTPLYREVTETHLPAGLAGPCMDAAAGDSDGDGDPDLALAMEFQPNILLLNEGAGVFADASGQLPRAAHDSEDVAFADFDADGDLDLVFVSEDDRTDELYINDGTGRFTDASARLQTDDVSNALVVLDLNGDGAPDILTGNIGVDRALINDGQGGFRDETAERWEQDGESRTQDLEAVDVDGDGALDVIVANEGQDQLYLNKDGRLVDVTAASLPAVNNETREIRAADVDGDGDSDLLVANVQFGMDEPSQDVLLLNDGAGEFTEADPAAYPEDGRSNFTVQAADLDHDGDIDVLAPSTVFPATRSTYSVLAYDDAGRSLLAHAANVDIEDADGDGDNDAVARDGDRSHIFVNDGGRLLAGSAAGSWPTSETEDIDMDDDGEPDIGVTVIPDGDAGGDGSLQAVDIDRDGDADLFVATTPVMESVGDTLVLLNDGGGRFSAAEPGAILPLSASGNGFDIEVADFNADGVDDLFLCNRASMRDAAADSGGLQRLLLGRPAGD